MQRRKWCQPWWPALWMTPEALSCWQAPKRTTSGGQPRYSDLALGTALTLGLVYGLPLRQTEGFITSVWTLIGLDLAVSNHTIRSRRASKQRAPNKPSGDRIPLNRPVHVLIDSTGLQVYGTGQWLEEKHGVKSRRGWRKLHLAVDANCGEIIAHVVTDQDAGDASQMEPLLDQIDMPIGKFTADGAYDGEPTCDAVTRYTGDGRMKWQAATGYGKQSLIETAIGRCKSIIGRRLLARSLAAQQTEVAIGCDILNRMLACARPKSARIWKANA